MIITFVPVTKPQHFAARSNSKKMKLQYYLCIWNHVLSNGDIFMQIILIEFWICRLRRNAIYNPLIWVWNSSRPFLLIETIKHLHRFSFSPHVMDSVATVWSETCWWCPHGAGGGFTAGHAEIFFQTQHKSWSVLVCDRWSLFAS